MPHRLFELESELAKGGGDIIKQIDKQIDHIGQRFMSFIEQKFSKDDQIKDKGAPLSSSQDLDYKTI